MQDAAKYLIHADITANGVVERSDVVGAIYGQTEGLLGSDLDLRALQDSSQVGRIDVDVESEGGQSFGEITIASGLDRVETAILAASLETIDRVGPCRATIEISELEDVRSAKRRRVVERATDLLDQFEAETITSRDIVDEVRRRVRVADVTEYEDLPAGPRVADSDAVVVVEGRADVLQLLEYGVKNAVAVEGTDVPDAVADLTTDRTVTAFLDGDRGGELVLRELAQVGDVDHVAFAPSGRSVEDLSREEALTALREKVPYDAVAEDDQRVGTADVRADDSAGAMPEDHAPGTGTASGETAVAPVGQAPPTGDADGTPGEEATTDAPSVPGTGPASETEDLEEGTATQSMEDAPGTVREPAEDAPTSSSDEESDTPAGVAGHAREVIGEARGVARLLDADAERLTEGPAAEAFDLVAESDQVPATVVLDAPVTQRLLDVAAQRGVDQVVGAERGEFVKRPADVRVRTLADF